MKSNTGASIFDSVALDVAKRLHGQRPQTDRLMEAIDACFNNADHCVVHSFSIVFSFKLPHHLFTVYHLAIKGQAEAWVPT